MLIGHYYPTVLTEPSGVTAAIESWVETQRLSGHDVVVFSDGPGAAPGHVSVPHYGRRRLTRLPRFRGPALADLDVLTLHEGWTPSHYAAAAQAAHAGTPYIVMPHGVYEPSIMKRLKSPRRVRWGLERRLLERAAAVHVFFESETALVREVASVNEFIVLPTPAPPPLSSAWAGGGGYLAWFGRYDVEHKGLDLLLEALARIPAHERPRVRLRGHDFKGGLASTLRLVESLRLGEHVEVGGPVTGREKSEFVAKAEAFVHPSRWESQGIALLEVMGAGAPTIVSSSIHLAPVLAARGAAMLVEPTADGWAQALRHATDASMARIGARGREYVTTELDRAVTARRFDELLASLPLPHASRR
jgi:glycosyltransferase involved in cell wall biosynthesis